MYSTADFTSPDPGLWARITGAVTAAEAEEGCRSFVEAVSAFGEIAACAEKGAIAFGEAVRRSVEGTEGGTVLKDSMP